MWFKYLILRLHLDLNVNALFRAVLSQTSLGTINSLGLAIDFNIDQFTVTRIDRSPDYICGNSLYQTLLV